MDIGNRILQLRKQKGVTQQQLADYLAVLPQTISRWEAGGGMPDIVLLPKIAVFFGITLDELFGMRDMDQILQLVMRYSVLRDEKSFEDAMSAVTTEEELAREEHDDGKRKQLMAYRMHLMLQKARQALKEADEIADLLIAETEDENDPLHLPVRLQKMQFEISGGNAVKCLKQARLDFEADPCMETLQILCCGLLHADQGDKVMALSDNAFVRKSLAGDDADSVTVRRIFFAAAAMTDDLDYFESHFDAYEKLVKRTDPKGNVIEVRKMLAELYADRGMTAEKEACKEKLLKELSEDEEIKKQELYYLQLLENIEKI